jgi:hypothetical protein
MTPGMHALRTYYAWKLAEGTEAARVDVERRQQRELDEERRRLARERRTAPRPGRQVVCLDTGKVYPNCFAASASVGRYRTAVGNALRGSVAGVATSGGRRFAWKGQTP